MPHSNVLVAIKSAVKVLAYDENTHTNINVFPEYDDSFDHQIYENGQNKIYSKD